MLITYSDIEGHGDHPVKSSKHPTEEKQLRFVRVKIDGENFDTSAGGDFWTLDTGGKILAIQNVRFVHSNDAGETQIFPRAAISADGRSVTLKAYKIKMDATSGEPDAPTAHKLPTNEKVELTLIIGAA